MGVGMWERKGWYFYRAFVNTNCACCNDDIVSHIDLPKRYAYADWWYTLASKCSLRMDRQKKKRQFLPLMKVQPFRQLDSLAALQLHFIAGPCFDALFPLRWIDFELKKKTTKNRKKSQAKSDTLCSKNFLRQKARESCLLPNPNRINDILTSRHFPQEKSSKLQVS